MEETQDKRGPRNPQGGHLFTLHTCNDTTNVQGHSLT